MNNKVFSKGVAAGGGDCLTKVGFGLLAGLCDSGRSHKETLQALLKPTSFRFALPRPLLAPSAFAGTAPAAIGIPGSGWTACGQGKVVPHGQGEVEQRRIGAFGVVRADLPSSGQRVLEPQPRQRTPLYPIDQGPMRPVWT